MKLFNPSSIILKVVDYLKHNPSFFKQKLDYMYNYVYIIYAFVTFLGVSVAEPFLRSQILGVRFAFTTNSSKTINLET